MDNIGSKLTFTDSPVYAFLSDVSKADIRSHLSARHAQLSAMLTLVMGDGTEALDGLSEEYRSNYLWACRSIAHECEELAKRL